MFPSTPPSGKKSKKRWKVVVVGEGGERGGDKGEREGCHFRPLSVTKDELIAEGTTDGTKTGHVPESPCARGQPRTRYTKKYDPGLRATEPAQSSDQDLLTMYTSRAYHRRQREIEEENKDRNGDGWIYHSSHDEH